MNPSRNKGSEKYSLDNLGTYLWLSYNSLSSFISTPLADFTIMSKTGEKSMKAGPSHPSYLQMVLDAITEIGNPKGSSR